MQVDERISVYNDAVQLNIEQKINQSKQEIISSIQQIVREALIDNQSMLTTKGSPEEVQAKATEGAQNFFATHITEDKMDTLKALPPRVKDVASRLVNKAVPELMVPPMGEFLGMMSALTTQQNLINFFLIQSMGPAQRLTDNLEKQYMDNVLDQYFSK